MENTKTIKGRISHKHGTEEYWLLSVYKSLDDLSDANKHDNPFIPLPGELIIYDPSTNDGNPRVKYGDPADREGRRNVVELPFADEDVVGAINEIHGELGDVSTALGGLVEKAKSVIGGN